MLFQALISTTDDKFFKRNLSLSFPFFVVNQLIENTLSSYRHHNSISYKGRGISNSRNMAIKHATGELCLISDDDLSYVENINSIIIDAFAKNPDCDILTFQVGVSDASLFKCYREKEFVHNILTIGKVSSVEIAFRCSSITKHGLAFDEDFGLGSTFPTGEEAVFLADSLKKGLKIKYIPTIIVYHPDVSSGGNYDNLELAVAKGAMLYRIFGWKATLLIPVFAFKHNNDVPYSLFRFVGLMMAGAFKYRKTKGSNKCE